jgi:hypothetical protein
MALGLIHDGVGRYVSSYYYMCVLVRLYMCPHTPVYLYTGLGGGGGEEGLFGGQGPAVVGVALTGCTRR